MMFIPIISEWQAVALTALQEALQNLGSTQIRSVAVSRTRFIVSLISYKM